MARREFDRLLLAVGIPLELTGTEVRVGPFSADVLARNPADDSVVLIENQLESSDRTHLGQILTYLSGLSAHTMIWIAPLFREEHVSAIRWLNEHTVDPFAFFAIRVRAVRIESSPLAPLFEVIEGPNSWDRRVTRERRAVEGSLSDLGQQRLAFWEHFLNRHPGHGEPDAASSRWTSLPGTDGMVVQYIAKSAVGVFVRPPRGGTIEELAQELQPWLAQLSAELSAPANGEGSFSSQRLKIDTQDPSNWDLMADWLDEQVQAYQTTFGKTLPTTE
ncbi:hypothetical protein [Erythrobacter sp.]|uniref:hypothetical protein n=1 Tax=Erythrobacter sp. TaxID=1042 RepID=UPI003C796711